LDGSETEPAEAVGRTEEKGRDSGLFGDDVLGHSKFIFDEPRRFESEVGVRVRMVTDLMAGRGNSSCDPGKAPDIFAAQEEGRSDVLLIQIFEQFHCALTWAIVE